MSDTGWDYVTGLIAISVLKAWEQYPGKTEYYAAVKAFADRNTTADGSMIIDSKGESALDPSNIAATAGSKILFAGGGKSAVDIYDASTNSWSTARLSQPRDVSSTATLGNKVLFFTGYDDGRRMDIYDASTNAWSAAELNKPLYSIAIAAGNQVFIGGGRVKAIGSSQWAYTNRVWKLSF